ncbi:Cys-tRNA(Pro) deacylase [Aestuariicella sp. G3-2]|uniref:Cys-tRNA(Pro) deacylase n=1 Tax=Pseudomaricurvus albidus TaxID=2842452 RepID=UPI001C0B5192|nr:Cys-tRNA(Pro) deacylase [Aestuariicella albida]MBU3068319.1 Cys-tRNA(Pro) deacylase [Aestuariicella albida]
MTPAINLAKKHRIAHRVHEYTHDAGTESYGLEAAEKMGVDPRQVFKTLVVQLDSKQLAVGVVPVSAKLNLKAMAKACGAKKAAMADKQEVERSSGYVLGGVSPLGQKKLLKTVLDASAAEFSTIFVSAGRRGLEIELSPADLQSLVKGQLSPIAGQ